MVTDCVPSGSGLSRGGSHRSPTLLSSGRNGKRGKEGSRPKVNGRDGVLGCRGLSGGSLTRVLHGSKVRLYRVFRNRRRRSRIFSEVQYDVSRRLGSVAA